jgi:hypothetical protein
MDPNRTIPKILATIKIETELKPDSYLLLIYIYIYNA